MEHDNLIYAKFLENILRTLLLLTRFKCISHLCVCVCVCVCVPMKCKLQMILCVFVWNTYNREFVAVRPSIGQPFLPFTCLFFETTAHIFVTFCISSVHEICVANSSLFAVGLKFRGVHTQNFLNSTRVYNRAHTCKRGKTYISLKSMTNISTDFRYTKFENKWRLKTIKYSQVTSHDI
jgi:hypothetical protein